jgi:hypothetical protein
VQENFELILWNYDIVADSSLSKEFDRNQDNTAYLAPD